MKRSKRFIIGGGGTGGHIFPAISIAQALKEREPDAEILFVGAESKIEMEKVPAAGFKIEGLPVSGFQRKLSAKNLTFFFRLWRSMRKSVKIIKTFKPDLAIGVGGYASGPVLQAAARRGIPIVLQEQNSYAGITNRILSKRAGKIFVAYEEMEKYFPASRIILTGNPVRKEIIDARVNRDEAYRYFELDQKRPVILIIGGSQGAGTINKSILNDLQAIGTGIQLIWQTGNYYYDNVKMVMEGKAMDNIKIHPFLERMEYAFAVADIIVSRAGAGTISELQLVGKPAILVPSPNVAEDHQTKNAMALVKKDAAIHVADREAEEKLVPACLKLLNEKETRERLSKNIKSMALPDAAEKIADEILKMI